MNLEESLSLVYTAIQQVNAMRPPDDQIPELPDVVLVGEEGAFDSLAITTLILALEEGLREKTGRDLSVMGENSFDKLALQFRTPSAIAELITRLL